MTVTLDTCAEEPIHIPGSIQPHGILFACRGDALAITQVSRNLEASFGLAAEAAIGQPLGHLLGAAPAATIARAFAAPEGLREVNPLRITTTAGASFDAVLHVAKDGQLVVELEPSDGGPVVFGFDPRLRTSAIRMQRAHDLAALSQIAADEVRTITGFDRVMIYRFDRDWNGEVVAEAKRDDLEPFLGLHYPHSDIPAQARRLYAINWLRFIGDVGYRPVAVVPTVDPITRAPLDMSFGTLRSVSPIHIEYLRNMGVSASMSVSLVHDGKLIGLIACHHYSGPHLISFLGRETAEYIGRALSWNIVVLEGADVARRAREAAERETTLVRAISRTNEFLAGLASPELLALTEAAGAVVVLAEGSRRIGECPPAGAVDALVAWLRANRHDVFSTDHAAAAVPVALGDLGAGVLAVAISPALGEYLVWFRPSSDRTVDWAGDPRKAVLSAPAETPPRLSPRGSFALWRETIHGHAEPWDDIVVDAASNLRKTLLSGVRVRASELSAYNQRLLDADRAKDDFIATVSHELRTPLNAISGWAHLLNDATALTPDRLRHGLAVIERNAHAQTQIVDDLLDVSRMVSGKLTLDLATVNLHDLVVDVLASVEVGVAAKDLRLRRVLETTGGMVLGDASRLRQVVANLLNNAIKFTPKTGSITVTLRRLDSELELGVQDSGQGITPEFLPLVFDVFRQADSGLNRRTQGLGLGLAIARKLVELHGGRITAESPGAGKGALFRVRIPLASVHLASNSPPHGEAAIPGALAGIRALVVEDETDSRELLCHILSAAGAHCTPCATAAEALAALDGDSFAVVISDIGMPGQDGLQLMRALRARPADRGGRLPAIALTAYTRSADRSAALNAGFDAHLGKPVDANELVAVVSSVVARARR